MRYVCLVTPGFFCERETDKYLNAHRLRLPNIDADRDNPIWNRIPGDFGAMSLEFSNEREIERERGKERERERVVW